MLLKDKGAFVYIPSDDKYLQIIEYSKREEAVNILEDFLSRDAKEVYRFESEDCAITIFKAPQGTFIYIWRA